MNKWLKTVLNSIVIREKMKAKVFMNLSLNNLNLRVQKEGRVPN